MNLTKKIGNSFSSFKDLYDDQSTGSLLTKPQSNAIKGLLIILIILGHNKYIMDGQWCFMLLYSFHIYSFFFLPFLYGDKPAGFWEYTLKNLKRLYIPYSIVFLILVALKYITSGQIQTDQTVIAFIAGSQFSLRQALGNGGFLWFIPTMFSLLIIKHIYYRSPSSVRGFLLIASLGCLLCYSLCLTTTFQAYCPFSLLIALALLFPAVVARYLSSRISVQANMFMFFSAILLTSIIYPLSSTYYSLYLVLSRMLCPVIIFLFIFGMKNYLERSKILTGLGKLSFQIYIIHIFLYHFAYMLINKYMTMNYYLGMMLTVIIAGLSYLIAKMRILKLIFPGT